MGLDVASDYLNTVDIIRWYGVLTSETSDIQ